MFRSRLRRLPETFIPDDAGLTFAFKEGWREHSPLFDRQPDAEGGRQDKSDGMKVDRNRLTLLLSLPILLCACAGGGPSGFNQHDEHRHDGEGPVVYGRISVSVDAIDAD